MKFSCDKVSLQSAISMCSRAVATKSSIPALGGLLLRCDGETLRVCGYNMTLGIRTEIHADVENAGELVLDAGLFGGIVSRLPDDTVTVSSGEKNVTKLTCGNASFEISGLDAADFLQLPEIEQTGIVEVEEKILRSMVQQTSYAISTNENHPAQMGSLFEVAGKQLTVVSCDGFRVALRREEIEYSGEDLAFIAPGTTLKEVEKICADSSAEVRITLGDRHILFNIGSTEIISRRLDGQFLDYKKAIPDDQPISIDIEPQKMLESLDRVTVVVSDKFKAPIRCVFDVDHVTLSANTAKGGARDVCSYKGDGSDLEIGFNGRYLAEAMRYAPADKVTVRLRNAISPAVISAADGSGKFLYMVLPVRLKAATK